MIGNPSDHAFGKVDVQVVGDDVPFGLVRRAGDQPIEEAGEVVFGASRPDDTALCLPFISSGVHQERRPVRRHW